MNTNLTLFPAQPFVPMQQGWWHRNAKWVIAASIFALLVIGIALIVVLSLVVGGTIKSSGVLNQAIETASKDPRVIEQLGEPLSLDGFPSGIVTFEETPGFADVVIPVEGPKGTGKLKAIAEKVEGRWVFSSLVLEQSNGQTIPLIGELL